MSSHRRGSTRWPFWKSDTLSDWPSPQLICASNLQSFVCLKNTTEPMPSGIQKSAAPVQSSTVAW